MEILTSYDFVIEHLEGKQNPAVGQLSRPDSQIGYEHITGWLLATIPVQTTITESYGDLVPVINTAQETYIVATKTQLTSVDVSIAEGSRRR